MRKIIISFFIFLILSACSIKNTITKVEIKYRSEILSTTKLKLCNNIYDKYLNDDFQKNTIIQYNPNVISIILYSHDEIIAYFSIDKYDNVYFNNEEGSYASHNFSYDYLLSIFNDIKFAN